MREDVIKLVWKEKLIVIVRGVEEQRLIPLAEAMYEGGIRLLEITYSPDGSISDERTAENIKLLSEHFQGKMLIGSGTTLTEKQVEYTKEAGGEFIISPDVNPDVIRKTRRLEMVSMPGALTPSEIQTAHICGADFVKLFPVSSLGSSYVKAVKAPLSHIKFLAVGGINEENMAEYIRSGVCGFGIGTNIVDKKMLADDDYAGITRLARKYTEEIKKCIII